MVSVTGAVNKNHIIMDNGSGYLKMGFAGDQFPRCTIPTIVGTPELRSGQQVGDVQLKEVMYADEANPHRGLLQIEHPIAEGTVKNWERFEGLWNYSFRSKLGKTNPTLDGCKILVTEAALNPKKNREKMAELIFEKFEFDGCYFESQALLSLMAEGRNEGLVFDSGDGVSHVIPVVAGFIQENAVERLNMAGRHVTDYLTKLLQQRGYAFNSSADFEIVREIKE